MNIFCNISTARGLLAKSYPFVAMNISSIFTPMIGKRLQPNSKFNANHRRSQDLYKHLRSRALRQRLKAANFCCRALGWEPGYPSRCCALS